jgi:tetratricopeptide (TPR) repeat protein
MKAIKNMRTSSILVAALVCGLVVSHVRAQEPGTDASLAKIRSDIRSARYQDALKDASDALSKNPADGMAWCLKGEAQTRLKDTPAALESFDKAFQADKTNINAVVGKANALAELKKEAEAQALLQQALSMTPSSATDFLARGAAFRALVQYDKALSDYDEALKLDAAFTEVHMNKGMVYWHKGDFAAAIPAFTAAIELDPNFVEALVNRGAAYRKKGDIESAIADYTKAIEINPNDAMTFYNRGVAYQKQQMNEEAIGDFSSAIRLQPKYPEAYLNRAVAYTGVNKLAEAKKDFQVAADQDPSGEAGRKARIGLQQLQNF